MTQARRAHGDSLAVESCSIRAELSTRIRMCMADERKRKGVILSYSRYCDESSPSEHGKARSTLASSVAQQAMQCDAVT